jgi:hypothetical protein
VVLPLRQRFAEGAVVGLAHTPHSAIAVYPPSSRLIAAVITTCTRKPGGDLETSL